MKTKPKKNQLIHDTKTDKCLGTVTSVEGNLCHFKRRDNGEPETFIWRFETSDERTNSFNNRYKWGFVSDLMLQVGQKPDGLTCPQSMQSDDWNEFIDSLPCIKDLQT